MNLRERLGITRSPAPALHAGPRSPLPYLMPLANSFGTAYFLDKIFIEYHGAIDFKNFPELTADALRFVSLERDLNEFSISQAAFLDIETTGTAGGAGTLAFLVGLGFVEKGYFQIRQFFLHDPGSENAFLNAIAEFTQRFRYLITYNGKCFDAQILQNRYLMHRWENPLADKFHIDMLFAARRLWKRSHHNCDLMNLEREVLHFWRDEDIPGFMIPSAYADFLRNARAAMIQKILLHNQWDIASLAVLTARACLLPSEEGLSAPEHFSLSLLYQRQKNHSAAVHHQFLAMKSQQLDGYRGAVLL